MNGTSPRQHLVEHDAQRIDVAALVAALPLHLFRRNVVRRAQRRRRIHKRQPPRIFLHRDAKIDQLDRGPHRPPSRFPASGRDAQFPACACSPARRRYPARSSPPARSAASPIVSHSKSSAAAARPPTRSPCRPGCGFRRRTSSPCRDGPAPARSPASRLKRSSSTGSASISAWEL